MYVLNKLKESHGTHLSTFIQVGPRVTKYWMEIVFEGANKFCIKNIQSKSSTVSHEINDLDAT